MLVGRRFGMYTPTSSDYNRNVIPSYNTTLACLYKCCLVVCKQGNIVDINSCSNYCQVDCNVPLFMLSCYVKVLHQVKRSNHMYIVPCHDWRISCCNTIIMHKLVLGTPQSGTLILKRNGVYSQSFNSGRVVVYGVGSPTSSTRFWGNVCRRTAFNTNAAHVICHQLTYSGASTWSYAAIDS